MGSADMAERRKFLHCQRCGSLAHAGDRFCVVSGARIPTDAPDAAHHLGIPKQIYAPSGVPPRGSNRKVLLGVAAGAVLLLMLAGAGVYRDV